MMRKSFAITAVLAIAVIAFPLTAAAAPGVLPRPGPVYAGWEVPVMDIAVLGSPRPTLLVKAFSPSTQTPAPVVRYLD
jgi:hypothetical protein